MHSLTTDRRLNFYLQIAIILLALITVRLWMIPADLLPRAQAQLPDSAAQRIQMIHEIEKTNMLLGDIHTALQGTLKVKFQEEPPEKPPGRAKP